MYLLLLIILSGCTLYPADKKSEIYGNAPFVSKIGPGTYESYLQMNIRFNPVKELFNKIDEDLGGKLSKSKARTEAHITVITPVEYRKILEPAGLSISMINDIAINSEIQKSDFDIICVGKASKDNKQTYYLVVESEALVNIRKRIFKKYIERGGSPSTFDPEHFYPHITIGYTDQDLHLESDGVFKGINSCWRKIDH